MRETLLEKALLALQDYEEPEFEVDPESNMVEEEIKIAEKKFYLDRVREKKEQVLVAVEIAKLALEEYLIDIAHDAAKLVIANDWDY